KAIEERLAALMLEKEDLEHAYCLQRMELQRSRSGLSPLGQAAEDALERGLSAKRAGIAALDHAIAPLAKAVGEVPNERWGLLLRAGNDKSPLARQVERSADVYTSRVSNFLHVTPYAYLRSPRGSLPHDPVRDPVPTRPAPDDVEGGS